MVWQWLCHGVYDAHRVAVVVVVMVVGGGPDASRQLFIRWGVNRSQTKPVCICLVQCVCGRLAASRIPNVQQWWAVDGGPNVVRPLFL